MPCSCGTGPMTPERIGLASDAIPRIAAPYRLQWEQAQDAWVLLFPEGMVKLNLSGGEILKRCDGRRSVESIVAEIGHTFAVDVAADVTAFLQLATERRWLEWRTPEARP